MAILNRTTKQWQEIDSAHQLHPFTDFKSLAEEGSIIISKANGVHLTNSDGKQLLDAMSGLWCVNIGYGRKSMAEVAYEQMQELPYYNSFFKTTKLCFPHIFNFIFFKILQKQDRCRNRRI